MKIPLFDTLTHPTPTGDWLKFVRTEVPHSQGRFLSPAGTWRSWSFPERNTLETLLAGMDQNYVKWAFAMGMKGIGGYTFGDYSAFTQTPETRGRLFPVAFADFNAYPTRERVNDWLAKVRINGYFGIKIHPRIGEADLRHPLVEHALLRAGELGIPVFICTYFYDDKLCAIDCLQDLGRLLALVPQTKVVLLHGGLIRVMEVMQFVKVFPNTLLDLSYTICKYEGSSVDLDIAYLFQQFDQKICVGSDNPDFSLSQLRRRFDHFSSALDPNKAENIAHKNIVNFTGLEPFIKPS